MDSAPIRVLLVSPKPPPAHGAARVVETLLDGCGGGIDWVHVDARYAADVSELQKVRLGKIVLLMKYLVQTALGSLRCRAVVLTPSFQLGTFYKDSLFVWLCWLTRRPVRVGWYHMSFTTLSYKSLPAPVRVFVRLTLRRLTHHVCVADRLTIELPEFLDQHTVRAIPNGTSDYQVRDQHRRQTLTVLYLSHMSEAKGWKVLLEVAGDLCAEHYDIQFLFFGGPAYETRVEDIEAAFHASLCPERIRYMGYADEEIKRRIFGEVDVLCFPSMNEAFPITLLEAMSASLPIVASNVGGIADAVVDGEGGILVRAGDAVEMRVALDRLLGDASLRARHGLFNRRRYEEMFTEGAFCDRWCEFFKAVIIEQQQC
jgi:glycosyltransferase involved in cell wall biosynthesis